MAYQSYWYQTNLPKEIVDILEQDLSNFDDEKQRSTLINNNVNIEKRNSDNAWIPTTHWLAGFLWHYIHRANRENFMYDLTGIDGETLQYTFYQEGQFYDWHTDSNLSIHRSPLTYEETLDPPKEFVRKLSVVLQLTDENLYKGGDLEIQDYEGNKYTAPRARGSVIMFDSRALHRVAPVTEGIRKSIVGWVIGPRWK